MKKSLFLIPLVLLSVCACTPRQNQPSSEIPSSSSEPLNPDDFTFGTYSNPVAVWSGSTKYTGQVADPTVVRGDDGKFYCVATGGVMLESDDACEWYVLTTSVIPHPTWADSYYEGKIPGFWAPDLVKIGNKWMLYYSLSVWGGACGIGYASADNIRGPYTDHGKLFDSGEVSSRDNIQSP